jgi:hypothetical protein
MGFPPVVRRPLWLSPTKLVPVSTMTGQPPRPAAGHLGLRECRLTPSDPSRAGPISLEAEDIRNEKVGATPTKNLIMKYYILAFKMQF